MKAVHILFAVIALGGCSESTASARDPYKILTTDTLIVQNGAVDSIDWGSGNYDARETFSLFNESTNVRPKQYVGVRVVREYVKDGRVVGSDTLTDRHGIGVQKDGDFYFFRHSFSMFNGNRVRRTVCPVTQAKLICDVRMP